MPGCNKVLQIRHVTANDITQCHLIEARCFPADQAASKERIRLRQEIFPEGFLVAVESDQVVGLINSGAFNQPLLEDENFKALVGHDSSGRGRVIFSLAVDPDWRGQGVAQQLLKTYLLNSKKENVRVVRLICKQELINFYQSFGLETIGRSNFDYGGVDWWEMKIDLL